MLCLWEIGTPIVCLVDHSADKHLGEIDTGIILGTKRAVRNGMDPRRQSRRGGRVGRLDDPAGLCSDHDQVEAGISALGELAHHPLDGACRPFLRKNIAAQQSARPRNGRYLVFLPVGDRSQQAVLVNAEPRAPRAGVRRSEPPWAVRCGGEHLRRNRRALRRFVTVCENEDRTFGDDAIDDGKDAHPPPVVANRRLWSKARRSLINQVQPGRAEASRRRCACEGDQPVRHNPAACRQAA